RRSRNIGTPKQGHGQNNKLTIPTPCTISKSFFERLGTYEKIEATINDHVFMFIVEATRGTCRHACSIMDIEKIIKNIPIADYGDLKLIILRQPKTKEEILSPVWGRLIYSYQFEGNYYPAIIIEAVDYEKKLVWDKRQSPEASKEFDRLKADGHNFVGDKRGFKASLTIENVRNTQLYRTLIHEFGHYAHYLEIVERPGRSNEGFEEWEKRSDKYHKISSSEKESYAHKYADVLIKKLKTEKIIPFECI
ncbi:MAG: hypothetical protein ABI113_05225, partial [Mucilaginibacter sp.]